MTDETAVDPVRHSPSVEVVDKGLRAGALGLAASVVIGVASTAPAYSLAATLGFIVAGVGLQSPIIVILAFVPMLFTAIGYSELNKADPDCGTTFTWATRAFGPKTGWLGGWGILAADILVMASLAQVAGQYVFLLFNADGIGHDPTSNWVLLVGVLWIVLMTYICYVGITVSARLQTVLLTIELLILLVFSVVALVRVGAGNATAGSIHVHWSWFDPFHIGSFSVFFRGLLLMIFIYWGWDSAVSVNEETTDPAKTPGRAAVLSTILLVVTYTLVTLAAQSFAGDRDDRDRARQRGQLRRCAVGAGQRRFRRGLAGLDPEPPAGADGVDVGGRVHPDNDPAHRPHHPVDGHLQGAAQACSARYIRDS